MSLEFHMDIKQVLATRALNSNKQKIHKDISQWVQWNKSDDGYLLLDQQFTKNTQKKFCRSVL